MNRKIVTASLGAYTGDDLRELWVDAKDIGTTYQIAAPDGSGGYTYTEATYTDEEYAAVLRPAGWKNWRRTCKRWKSMRPSARD